MNCKWRCLSEDLCDGSVEVEEGEEKIHLTHGILAFYVEFKISIFHFRNGDLIEVSGSFKALGDH